MDWQKLLALVALYCVGALSGMAFAFHVDKIDRYLNVSCEGSSSRDDFQFDNGQLR